MAEAHSQDREPCVNKDAFYEALNQLKSKQKTSASQITLTIDDQFYDRAKDYLKSKVQDDQHVVQTEVGTPTIQPLSTWENTTITRKKWKYLNDNIVTEDGRKVVPKHKLYDVLSLAHHRIAHRGRQITLKWIQDNYAEVNQKVVNIFTNMCKFHAKQMPITSCIKPVKQPLSGETFLSLLEIDLMDFRKCPCTLHSEPHKWAVHFIDHHTKFTHVLPLHNKSGEEVLNAFKKYCLTFGYPQKIITDNGKEFKNEAMNRFCDHNGIKVSHGAPRTPTTQGLVERANRIWKENTRSLIMSTARKVDHWCETTLEVSYTMNISHHSTIKTSPYEAVYGFKPHRENSKNPPETEQDSQIERQRKRQKIQENQKKCNQKMLDSSSKKKNNTFKVNNIVSIKIDKVDKSSAFHPNLRKYS